MKRLLLGIVFVVAFAGSQSHAQTRVLREITFCEENTPYSVLLKSPVPTAIVSALMNTVEGRRARREARDKGKPLAESALFVGTRIRLAGSAGTFFVVMGSSPMSGADNTWFWLVQQQGAKVTILLFTGGNCLTLLPTMTSGYRDIEADWASPGFARTEIYKWNGQSYKLRRRRSREQKPDDQPSDFSSTTSVEFSQIPLVKMSYQ